MLKSCPIGPKVRIRTRVVKSLGTPKVRIQTFKRVPVRDGMAEAALLKLAPLWLLCPAVHFAAVDNARGAVDKALGRFGAVRRLVELSQGSQVRLRNARDQLHTAHQHLTPDTLNVCVYVCM